MPRAAHVLWVILAVAGEHLHDAGAPQSAQSCNTECQSAFTDCMDRCDQLPSCEARCVETIGACVKRCSAPEPVPSAR